MSNQMINDNLKAIQALKKSRVKSAQARATLQRRIEAARGQVSNLRSFASKRPGPVANHCAALADEIEAIINE